MESVPKDLGQRIVEAARLAVLMHSKWVTELTDEIGRAEFDPRAASLVWSAGMPSASDESEAA